MVGVGRRGRPAPTAAAAGSTAAARLRRPCPCPGSTRPHPSSSTEIRRRPPPPRLQIWPPPRSPWRPLVWWEDPGTRSWPRPRAALRWGRRLRRRLHAPSAPRSTRRVAQPPRLPTARSRRRMRPRRTLRPVPLRWARPSRVARRRPGASRLSAGQMWRSRGRRPASRAVRPRAALGSTPARRRRRTRRTGWRDRAPAPRARRRAGEAPRVPEAVAPSRLCSRPNHQSPGAPNRRAPRAVLDERDDRGTRVPARCPACYRAARGFRSIRAPVTPVTRGSCSALGAPDLPPRNSTVEG